MGVIQRGLIVCAAGTAVTVIVAVLCGYFINIEEAPMIRRNRVTANIAWQFDVYQHPAAARIRSSAFGTRYYPTDRNGRVLTNQSGTVEAAPVWSRVHQFERSVTVYEQSDMLEDARGWPLLALRGRLQQKSSLQYWDTEWAYVLPDYAGVPPRWVIALQPIWPGFVVNSIFYSILIALTWWLWRWGRNRIRSRRGQCPACAYPMRGASSSPRCSECGAKIPARQAMPAMVAQVSFGGIVLNDTAT